MLSVCCCTVSPTTSSTCFVCNCLRRCAPHKSKRCAFGCSRSGRASAKQLVASVFTWPAAGLFRIFSKPPATPLRLSRRFDNTFSESQAELSRKTVGEVKTTGNAHRYNGRPRTTVLFPYQRAFCATILASDELTRLGQWEFENYRPGE